MYAVNMYIEIVLTCMGSSSCMVLWCQYKSLLTEGSHGMATRVGEREKVMRACVMKLHLHHHEPIL